MTTVSTLCNLAGCVIDGIEQEAGELFILAHTEGVAAICPTCGQQSTSIHSYYTRTPKDLPVKYRPSLYQQCGECVIDVCSGLSCDTPWFSAPR